MTGVMLRGIQIYAIATFFVFWAVVGWQDWRRQKIQHHYLFYGLGAAWLGYGLVLANTVLGLQGKVAVYHHWAYYRAVMTHVCLCGSAALALWLLRIWPAGDTKLFAVLAFLYPLMSLLGSFQEGRIFLVVLINTFIPAAFYLFIRASAYVFNTRLRHWRNFLAAMGWKRELDYIRVGLGQALGGLTHAMGQSAARGLAGLPDGLPNPSEALRNLGPTLAQWLMGISSMSLVSYYVKDLFKSPLLLSLLCMAMFILWDRVSAALGTRAARLSLAAALTGLMLWFPPKNWALIASIFGSISVFSLFMFLGTNMAVKAMSEGAGLSAAFLLPLLIPAAGLMLGSLWRGALSVGHGLAGSLGGGGPGILVTMPSWTADVDPALRLILVLALLGLFFGLSLQLVRTWDDEVRPSHTREALTSYLVLDPAFIERIRRDQDFYEAYFETLYADGLTWEQAQALKDWCALNGIEAVPLAPTISFGFWIFLGFFLSWIMQGGHVLQAFL